MFESKGNRSGREVRRALSATGDSMPLALGLILVLPIVGALYRGNEAFASTRNARGTANTVNPTADQEFSAFAFTNILPEGEIRRIIRWKRICAKETIVDWGHTSVALREILLKDSRRKLQLIYEGETLTDCIEGDLSDNDIINCTMNRRTALEVPNNTEMNIEILENEDIGENLPVLRWLAEASESNDHCLNLRAREQSTSRQRHRRSERSLQRMVIAPGTKWCGPHRTANAYKELGALDHADRCCRRHDHCYRAIPPFSERYNLWNYMPFTLSHCGCDQRYSVAPRASLAKQRRIQRDRTSRSRRRREILLIPGTRWCGRGNRATKYTNLGAFGKADSCCRRHDTACPFYIPAFDSRYGLFNWGISTLMHCTCDERFRTCLKMAGTSSANFIGRIFFNVVQTKCFVLKPQKVCTRRNWRGKCEKHEYKKQAHIRNNVPY